MTTEGDIQNMIRLKVTEAGGRVMRNNTGVRPNDRGELHQYGLGKGSSDLIGWWVTETAIQPLPPMPWHNEPLAIFLAIEVKRPGQKPTAEQIQFLDAVNNAGGIGIVCSDPDQVVEQIRERRRGY